MLPSPILAPTAKNPKWIADCLQNHPSNRPFFTNRMSLLVLQTHYVYVTLNRSGPRELTCSKAEKDVRGPKGVRFFKNHHSRSTKKETALSRLFILLLRRRQVSLTLRFFALRHSRNDSGGGTTLLAAAAVRLRQHAAAASAAATVAAAAFPPPPLTESRALTRGYSNFPGIYWESQVLGQSVFVMVSSFLVKDEDIYNQGVDKRTQKEICDCLYADSSTYEDRKPQIIYTALMFVCPCRTSLKCKKIKTNSQTAQSSLSLCKGSRNSLGRTEVRDLGCGFPLRPARSFQA